MDSTDGNKRPRRSERLNLKKQKFDSSAEEQLTTADVKQDELNKDVLQVVKQDELSKDVLQVAKQDEFNEDASCSSTNILSLPDEICKLMFSYLSINDRLNSSLVCRKWLKFLDCPLLLEDICVRIDKDVRVAKECSHLTRRFSNFEFYKVTITRDFLEFLAKYRKTLRKVSFTRCKLAEPPVQITIETFRCFESLKSLHFNSCYFSLFSYLPALEEFVVNVSKLDHRITWFSEDDLIKLGKTVPNLKIMRLILGYYIPQNTSNLSAGSDSEEEPEVVYDDYDFFDYGNKHEYKAWHVLGRSSQVRPETLFEFVERRKGTMVEFEIIQGLYFLSSFRHKLSNMEGLKLKKFSFDSYNNRMTADIIKSFCENVSTLIDLDFDKYEFLDDEILTYVCTALPELESLVVKGNVNLNASIVDVFKLKHLRSLTLNHCNDIKRWSFYEALIKFESNRLTTFTVVKASIEDFVLKELLEKMRDLRHLHITSWSYAPYALSDHTVQSICKNLVRLRSLELIAGDLSDVGLFCPCDPEMHITHLKGLQSIKLQNTKVSTRGLLKNIKFLELHTLVLDDFSSKLGYKSSFKAQMKMQNPSLRCIELIEPWKC